MTEVTLAIGRRSRKWRTAPLVGVSCLAVLVLGARPLLPQQLGDAGVEAIAALLMANRGATVADVGAGAGFFAVKLAGRLGPRGLVYATEVKPDLVRQIQLAKAREGLDNVMVIVARHDDPGLPDHCCDAVLMRFVYHALWDPAETLKGLRRALKPGGRLLVIDFRPSVRELTEQMREFGFERSKLTDPWLGRKQTYGALFVLAGIASLTPVWQKNV